MIVWASGQAFRSSSATLLHQLVAPSYQAKPPPLPCPPNKNNPKRSKFGGEQEHVLLGPHVLGITFRPVSAPHTELARKLKSLQNAHFPRILKKQNCIEIDNF